MILKLAFNKQIVGVIIGKSGSNLQRLQDEYHVDIHVVNSPCYTAVDLECVIACTGTAANILDCMRALLGQLETNAVERRLPVDIQAISLLAAAHLFLHSSLSLSSAFLLIVHSALFTLHSALFTLHSAFLLTLHSTFLLTLHSTLLTLYSLSPHLSHEPAGAPL